MAQLVYTLTLETDLLQDAVRDVECISRALARRHGRAFRALEGRIERFVEADAWLSPLALHDIGGGRYVAGIPAELAAIIRDARDLGMIQWR